MRRILVILALFLTSIVSSASLRATADESASIVSKILGSFQGATSQSMNLTHFLTSFDTPTCLRRCMPTAMDNVGAILEASRRPAALRAMCSNLTESTKCATAAGCNALLVGAVSNAFQFMCMDNLDKVSSQLACIQDAAGDLQQDCESECAVQAGMIEKAAAKGAAADELFNMESMCNSTACLAHCYQRTIEKYCEIDGENNLLDTIFAQIDTLDDAKRPGVFGLMAEQKEKKSGIGKLIGWMLPEGCDDEALKIKIPKKIAAPEMPKSVGTPPPQSPPSSQDVASRKSKNELENEPKTEKANETTTTTTPEDVPMMKTRTANLSSAALMIGGKVQTLQCQMLDSKGNALKTPDFEEIYKILEEHFDKKTTTTTTLKPPVEEPKTRLCRGAPDESAEPRSAKAGATFRTALFTILPLFALFYV